MKGDAIMIYTVERRYFVNNEGTEVVQNLPYARIMVFGETKADDGMELPLNLSYLPMTRQIFPRMIKYCGCQRDGENIRGFACGPGG